MLLESFEHLYDDLKNLDDELKLDIIELIFCLRNHVLTITPCFLRFDLLKKYLIEKGLFELLENIIDRNAAGYGIDLSVLNGVYKIYVLHKEEKRNQYGVISGTGYNIRFVDNEPEIYEIKEYMNDRSYVRISKENDDIKIEKSKEILSDRCDWKGPKEILDIVQENRFWAVLLTKEDKNQSYLRISPLRGLV